MSLINKLATFSFFAGVVFITTPIALAQSDFDLFDDDISTEKSTDTVEISPVKPDIVQETKDEHSASDDAVTNVETGESDKSVLSTGSEENEVNKNDDPKYRETWLESLIAKGTSELFKSSDSKAIKAEKRRLAKVMQKKRSNAANFDISNIKLRMTPAEIEKILTAQGYKRLSQEIRVPNFIKWRAEEICRIHGIVGFERLKACAREIAKANGYEYVAYEIYNRHTTLESLEIAYSSTFTDNLSYRILYKSDLPLSSSKASEYVYINNLKIYDFWRRVDIRYGKPDNTSEVKWGLGGKKPYLQASTGKLELVDPLLKDLDISRMINEDSRLSNVPYYSF